MMHAIILERCADRRRALETGSKRMLKRSILFLIKAAMTAAVLVSFLFVAVRYYPETDFHFWGFVAFGALYLALFLLFSSTYRCFLIGVLRLRELVFSFILATLLTNCLAYLVLALTAKSMLRAGPMCLLVIAQWAAGILLLLLGNRLSYRLREVRDAAVVVGTERSAEQVLQRFETVRERYRITAVFHASDGAERLLEELAPYSTVIVGHVEPALRLSLMDACFVHNKRLFLIPSVQDILFHGAHETFVGDSLVYLCRNRAMPLGQRAVKRLTDVLFSVVGIVLTSPIMLAAAIAVKAYDGGPVLYRQERYTKDCKRFLLVKFRSMIVDAEKDGAQLTVDNDPRITPVGRVLRRTRIDELPQFFNILRGEMSLVGPRAERIENVEYYCALLPEFRYRMKVKAGLTGYAQIFGHYNTSYEEKLKMDLLYIENSSMLLDLKLLFLTARALLLPSSTAGFRHATLREECADAAAQQAGTATAAGRTAPTAAQTTPPNAPAAAAPSPAAQQAEAAEKTGSTRRKPGSAA